MGEGILICGLNGSGKSTLGRALADALGFRLIDSEDLYFAKDDPAYAYASPRSREEAVRLLMEKAAACERFIFVAVKGDYGEAILPLYRLAVLVETPRAVRLERVRNRSFERFGDRMLPGGDLYEPERAFFEQVSARTEEEIEDWVGALRCPVVRVDGTRPAGENARIIAGQMKRFER